MSLGSALPRLDDIPNDTEPEAVHDAIVDAAQTYLQSRPRLDGIFAAYSPLIDPTNTFLPESEATYALTLRQIEFSGIRDYLQQMDDEHSGGIQ